MNSNCISIKNASTWMFTYAPYSIIYLKKYYYIIHFKSLFDHSKVLITTFTEANEREIKKKFIEINGCIPPNVTVQTWFSFLLQHGVRPYQSVICDQPITGLQLVNAKSGL